MTLDAASLAGSTFWLTTTFGDLDLSCEPSGTFSSEDLRRDAVEVTLRGRPVLLASLADIIRSTKAAGRDKDHRGLPALGELLAQQLLPDALDPGAPQIPGAPKSSTPLTPAPRVPAAAAAAAAAAQRQAAPDQDR